MGVGAEQSSVKTAPAVDEIEVEVCVLTLGTIKELRNPFLDSLDLPPPPYNPM